MSQKLRAVWLNLASPHFFDAMSIPILRGRGIEERDRAGAALVAVVNETFARIFCEGQPCESGSPVGRRFTANTLTDGTSKRDYEIVGVVRDSKYDAIRTSTPPTLFLSYQQSPNDGGNMAFELRTSGDPVPVAAAVRRSVAQIDANVPVFALSSEEETIDALLSQDRLFAGLSAVFAGIAVLLAAIGLYGVRAYAVAQRVPEIGIRMALGAGRGAIVRMISRETFGIAVAGVAIGIGVAYATTRYVKAMLFGLAPHDLPTFMVATAVIAVVALLSGYVPARRAARVDPAIALRNE